MKTNKAALLVCVCMRGRAPGIRYHCSHSQCAHAQERFQEDHGLASVSCLLSGVTCKHNVCVYYTCNTIMYNMTSDCVYMHSERTCHAPHAVQWSLWVIVSCMFRIESVFVGATEHFQ